MSSLDQSIEKINQLREKVKNRKFDILNDDLLKKASIERIAKHLIDIDSQLPSMTFETEKSGRLLSFSTETKIDNRLPTLTLEVEKES